MQRRPNRRLHMTDTVLLSGWLFADLLLALAVIFLTSTNVIAVRPISTPTATPSPTAKPAPTPTPTLVPTAAPLPRLELKAQRLKFTIDTTALLNGSQATINNLEQLVRQQQILRGRSVGLVIAYGGASTVDQISQALQIATKVMDVLKLLGKDGFVFTRASYYDPLYVFGSNVNTNDIIIDIYLFF